MREMIARMLATGFAILALGLVMTSGAESAGLSATASIIDSSGNFVGTATFREIRDGRIRISVSVTGFTPGKHGMHVHTIGSCVTPTFTSAGSHFNPAGVKHANHAGDLPNLIVDSQGRGRAQTVTSRFTLSPGAYSLFDADGSALVIHANQDDLVTDPTGNSGARIACGVVALN